MCYLAQKTVISLSLWGPQIIYTKCAWQQWWTYVSPCMWMWYVSSCHNSLLVI